MCGSTSQHPLGHVGQIQGVRESKELVVPAAKIQNHGVKSDGAGAGNSTQHGFWIFFVADPAGQDDEELVERQAQFLPQRHALVGVRRAKHFHVDAVVEPPLGPCAVAAGHVAKIRSERDTRGRGLPIDDEQRANARFPKPGTNSADLASLVPATEVLHGWQCHRRDDRYATQRADEGRIQ